MWPPPPSNKEAFFASLPSPKHKVVYSPGQSNLCEGIPAIVLIRPVFLSTFRIYLSSAIYKFSDESNVINPGLINLKLIATSVI